MTINSNVRQKVTAYTIAGWQYPEEKPSELAVFFFDYRPVLADG